MEETFIANNMTLMVQGLTPFSSGSWGSEFPEVALVSAFASFSNANILITRLNQRCVGYWVQKVINNIGVSLSELHAMCLCLSGIHYSVCLLQHNLLLLIMNCVYPFLTCTNTHGAQWMMQGRCSFFTCVFTCNIQRTVTHLFLDIVESLSFRSYYIRLCAYLMI